MIKKRPLISLKGKQWSTFDQLQSLASEAPNSSISKNQKKFFKPGHFYAKLSIKIDIKKCLKITEVMLSAQLLTHCTVMYSNKLL